jgi:hypothetical protein
MAQMQKVEASVCNHQSLPAGSHFSTPLWQVIPGNNFLAKVHETMLVKTALKTKSQMPGNCLDSRFVLRVVELPIAPVRALAYSFAGPRE